MEQHTKKDEDLKEPVLVNIIQKAPDAPSQERCQEMHRDENGHADPADAMQDKSQHGSLSFIAQGRRQADIPIQAHLSLLESLIWGKQPMVPFVFPVLNVTILTVYSVQTSSKKEWIDPYNP
jgi:hypothetical protein